MKKQYLFILVFFSSLLFSNSFAQSFRGLDEAPHDIVYLRESQAVMPLVKVLYGRPKKAEGTVFGDQVPFGKIWRTGADEATEIRFYKAVQFGEVKVPAGTYVLYTIPGADEWQVILNSKLDVLGAFQYDPGFDIAKIKVPVRMAEALENFSIAFKEKGSVDQMVLGWGTTRVVIPLVFEAPSALANQF